jgi:hypothetical protein
MAFTVDFFDPSYKREADYADKLFPKKYKKYWMTKLLLAASFSRNNAGRRVVAFVDRDGCSGSLLVMKPLEKSSRNLPFWN